MSRAMSVLGTIAHKVVSSKLCPEKEYSEQVLLSKLLSFYASSINSENAHTAGRVDQLWTKAE